MPPSSTSHTPSVCAPCRAKATERSRRRRLLPRPRSLERAMGTDLEALESSTGYRFTDREILHRALTHSSHVHEKSLPADQEPRRDNEQLEFLGDAVLGFLISESLVSRFPAHQE